MQCIYFPFKYSHVIYFISSWANCSRSFFTLKIYFLINFSKKWYLNLEKARKTTSPSCPIISHCVTLACGYFKNPQKLLPLPCQRPAPLPASPRGLPCTGAGIPWFQAKARLKDKPGLDVAIPSTALLNAP